MTLSSKPIAQAAEHCCSDKTMKCVILFQTGLLSKDVG
jgi:hypothetical protein